MEQVLDNNQTKEIQQSLNYYTEKIKNHPIKPLCDSAVLPKKILEDFAKAQCVDSTTWVTMLSLVKGSLKQPELREAVRMNILDEVGNEGIPHVTLCKRFVKSVGVSYHYDDYKKYSPASVYPVEVMMSLAGNVKDEIIGGWLLAQETLVPVVFSTFRPAYRNLPNADVQYLIEHEEVDAEDHARWMMDAVNKMLISDEALNLVLAGMDLGGRATIGVIDFLYADTLKLLSSN